jgi:hypothetical protein
MAIANQGYRQDLNFLEHANDTLALSNLGGVGLAQDLRIIQNNLRNTSRLPFNSFNKTTDEFIFTTDKVIGVSAISSIPDTGLSNTSLITVELTTPYHTYPGGLVTVAGVTGTGSTIFNGSYPSILIGAGGTNVSYRKPNCVYTGSGDNVSSSTVTYASNTDNVYTNDDVVTVSQSVDVGSTTLTVGTKYFVCDSDGLSKFKLSSTPSVSGISTVNIDVDPIESLDLASSHFNFIKDEPVTRLNLENFIRPEIQDKSTFGSYLNTSINGVFDSTQTKIENSNYFITKKYKGANSTTVDTEIKFEGTVNLFDPGNFNSNNNNVNSTTAISPGIFIGGTRAFSADNNPWTVAGDFLETNADEVTIGELLFGDEIKIDGITVNATSFSDIDNDVTAETFTHKVPIVVNGETYYLLMTPN